ncbi:MAG: hypothetical protein GF308_05655 [Candidatus Heimdallarchaeota archaeon]|nr:hypothetical protein [Candidatus Heimdallarchaeota archaeon]
MARTGFGWQLFGTIICGLIFSIPFVIGYFVYRYVQRKIEERKEITEEEFLTA